MTSKSDQNLLFGIIGLQMDFVRREQLVAATSTWLTDNARSLDEILVEQGALSEEDRQLLAPLVARHLDNHGGDPQQSLAALSSLGSVADELRSLGDKSIEATLSMVASDLPNGSHEETVAHASKASTSAIDATRDATDARFRILRSHAKGGLGEVYVATDTELNREVALKEIQSKYADDEASRLRFLLEAEVTGGLEHPGIVPVYGLGRYDDGRPFYAMRFIKGDSLQEAADRFHRPAKSVAKVAEEESPTGSPTSHSVDFAGLEFRKLLGRFIDVCQAIAYAHSRGVLHRDLKPGNIMLGKYGETLVVDWGLAKTRERDESTRVETETPLRPNSAIGSVPTMMGSAIGTPAFMPPEQAAGRLDEIGPASDVYSLGATLYYVLVGQPPIQGKDLPAVLKQVQAGDFSPPRDQRPAVPRPLNAICLRAMARNPADRYPSPQELADDAERFLADEPVRAFDEPMTVKVRRWVRKHQTLTVATAAVVLVTVVGLGVFSTIVSGKNRQLTAANRRATQARELAETNEAGARQQSQLALTTLTSVIGDIELGLRNLSGGAEIRRRLLNTSLAGLDDIATQYVDQASVDRQTMMAFVGIGDILRELGDEEVVAAQSDAQSGDTSSQQASAVKLAETFYRRAHEIAVKLAAADPQSGLAQSDVAMLREKLGDLQLQLGDTAAALQSHQDSLAIREKLAANASKNIQDQDNLAVSHLKLGDIQLQTGDRAAAMSSFQNSLEIANKLMQEHPENARAQRGVAIAYERIGDLQLTSSNTAAAATSYESSRELFEKLAADDPQNVKAQYGLATVHERRGDVQLQLGNPRAALAAYRNSCEIFDALATSDPENTRTQRGVATAYEKLGDMQLKSGDLAAAQASHQKSWDIRNMLATDDPQNVEAQVDLGTSYQKLGDVQLQLENSDAALAFYQSSREIREKLAGNNPQDALTQHDLAVSYGILGDMQLRSGDSAAALTSFQTTCKILEDLIEVDPQNSRAQHDLAMAYTRVGDVQQQLRNHEAALASFQTSRHIRAKLVADDAQDADALRDLIGSHFQLAVTNQILGDHESAATHYESAAKRLRQQIAKVPNDDTLRRKLTIVEKAVTSAKKADVALGDWDQLLKQPVETLPALLNFRGAQFAKQSRFSEAAQAADKVRELDASTSDKLYNAACVFSLCAASIKAAEGEELTAEQTEQRETWVNDAIATLKQAIAAGWDDFDYMQKDEDLATIRDRPELKALIPKSE